MSEPRTVSLSSFKGMNPLFALMSTAFFFSGCAVVEIKEAPAYHFSRSVLNIAVVQPIERKEAVTLASASVNVPSKTTRRSKTYSKPHRSEPRTASRPKLRKLISADKSSSNSGSRCTGQHCSEPKFVTAARRLFGLRMKNEHAFIQHVARVSDVIVKPKSGQSYPSALLDHVRLKGSFQVTGKPRPGDLVFFHGTKAGKAQNDERPTLVGIVERIDSQGTVFFLSQLGEVVDRSRCTAGKPHVRRDEKSGRVLNSFMRHKRRDDAAETSYLAGELLVGFGRI